MSRCKLCGARVAEPDKPSHVAECIKPALDERRAIQEYEAEQERAWMEEKR